MIPEELLLRARSGHYGAAATRVLLRDFSKWRIGGPCDLLVEPSSRPQIEAFLADTAALGVPVIVIGGGSNLLFSDAGFRGGCLRIASAYAAVAFDGEDVDAQAGIWVPRLARSVAGRGLSGLEHAIGIPGSLGGLVMMNGGSQRRSISEHLQTVTSISRSGRIVTRGVHECAFGYRDSVFRRSEEVILDARFRLQRGDPAAMRRRMLGILRGRRGKFPLKQPNCGSVFVSDARMYETLGPPGAVIEQAGLKGLAVGDAVVSQKHANFFVNAGHATAGDMLRLIGTVRHVVHERTGFWLRTEVLFVNSDGRIVPADEAVPA